MSKLYYIHTGHMYCYAHVQPCNQSTVVVSDMLTLKKTYHRLQEQENDNTVARVSKENTFDLLVAEWERLERENRECDSYMKQELVRYALQKF